MADEATEMVKSFRVLQKLLFVFSLNQLDHLTSQIWTLLVQRNNEALGWIELNDETTKLKGQLEIFMHVRSAKLESLISGMQREKIHVVIK